MLFNAGIEAVFRRWKLRLVSNGFLFDIGVSRSTNVRYADDVLLFGKTETEIQMMTELVLEEFSKVGLELNATKSKILTNEEVDFEYLDIAGDMVVILDESKTHRYLGRFFEW